MSGSQDSQPGNWRQSDNWRVPGPPHRGPAPASGALWNHGKNGSPSSQQDQRHSDGQGQPQEQVAGSRDRSQDLIAEGRRVYLGNLLYRVKPNEIEEMLAENGFEGQHEAIHISVDAVTGRNPGYCFIDFKSREAATNALSSLGGVTVQGRPVKVGPCQPKGAEKRWKSDNYKPTFQRWGDWSGSGGSGRERDGEARLEGVEQGPYGAIEHMREVRQAKPPPRLWVGGLSKMINQEQHDREIRGYFEGFKV